MLSSEGMGALPPGLDVRRRFRADEVIRMVEMGILREDDRIELVNGELLMVPPQGPEHGGIKDDLHERLARAYADEDVHVINQRPLVAGDLGLPEPDLAIIRGRARDYLTRHPTGADALLVIEIAKSSQARDREKAADYARGGVPVYWLLDLAERRLDVHEGPLPEAARYRQITSLAEGDEVSLPNLRLRWSVSSLLP
jgi:Uma2 family endonuclease